MTIQHTSGRLQLDDAQPGDIRRYLLAESNEYPHVVASVPIELQPQTAEANARRLAACWNVCEGIPTEMLESSTKLHHATGEMMRQRDELLEVVKRIDSMCEKPIRFSSIAVQEVARAALVKAEVK